MVAEWLRGFLLPLVAGGDVRVSHPLGARELELLRSTMVESGDAVGRIREARHRVAAEILPEARPPEIDEDALRLALAVQDLLFLGHPAAQGTWVRKNRLRRVARFAAKAVALDAPASDEALVARHTVVHHLFDLGRDDVRVSFWAGRREYRGAEPPARLLKWREVRRVREERWRVSILTEAVTDTTQRDLVLAILRASPLTDLFEPQRLDPPLDLAPLAGWIRRPTVARAVIDRWLSLGVSQIAGPLTVALVALCNQKGRAAEARVWASFAAHLHLCWLLAQPLTDPPPDPARLVPQLHTQAAGQPAGRDYFGLFAAAQRVGVGRPPDAGRDPRLARLIDAYAAACATVCGAPRVLELEGVLARGVKQEQVSVSA